MGKTDGLIISFTSLILSSMLSMAVVVAFIVSQYHYNVLDTIVMGYVYYGPFMLCVILITKEVFGNIRVLNKAINNIINKSFSLIIAVILVITYSLLPITHLISDYKIRYIDFFIAYVFGVILYFNLHSLFIKINSW